MMVRAESRLVDDERWVAGMVSWIDCQTGAAASAASTKAPSADQEARIALVILLENYYCILGSTEEKRSGAG